MSGTQTWAKFKRNTLVYAKGWVILFLITLFDKAIC